MDSSPAPSSSVNSLSIAFPTGILIFIMVVLLFQFKEVIPHFQITRWVVFVIVPYLIAVLLHFVTQQITCGKIDSAKAFKGGVATAVAMLVGMGISSLSWFRIPVVSVFAPLVIPSPSNTNASTSCCKPMPSLTELETQFPILNGLSYGFYLFFASMFGIVIGTSLSVTC